MCSSWPDASGALGQRKNLHAGLSDKSKIWTRGEATKVKIVSGALFVQVKNTSRLVLVWGHLVMDTICCLRIAQALPMYKGQDWNLYWWILTEVVELKGSNLSYALSYAKFILLFLICLEWRNNYFFFPFYISDNEAANSRILGLALVANAYFWTKESESKKYAPGEARTHNPGIALHCL